MANGKPVVVVPLLLYSDDTSGNKSKKWNKFDNWCTLLAGILLQGLFLKEGQTCMLELFLFSWEGGGVAYKHSPAMYM